MVKLTMPRFRARRPALAWLGCASLIPTTALAGSFTEDGSYQPDPAAILADGFDVAPPDDEALTQGEGEALEGSGYVVLSSRRSSVDLPLALPATSGQYVARLFARGNRVVGAVNVGYSALPTDPGTASFSAGLFPTGVVTSDGWYEIASAPFSIDAARAFQASLVLYASGADIDAFELVAVGEGEPLRTCEVAYDSACAAHQFCAAGFCRDGNVTVPELPEGDQRAALANYWIGRLELFFGGRLSRERHLDEAREVLTALAQAGSRWEFWNGFATAIHRLQDWHTTTSGIAAATPGRGAFPLCFVEGDADLSHDTAPADAELPDVLVSHGNPDLATTSGLKAGDRLVAVDGKHPIRFMNDLDAVDWSYWHANEPDAHAEAVERLRFAIRRWAKELTIVRCDAAAGTCSAPETLSVLDLPREEPALYPECDHRPSYPVAGPDPITHEVRSTFAGPVVGTTAEDAINGMVWNSVYAAGGNPFAEALDIVRAGKGALLDHRTGNGGTEYAAELLTQPFRAVDELGIASSFNLTIGMFDAPFDPAPLLASASADVFRVGSANYSPTLKTAMLLARDGSASDWLPLGLKGAPNVRLFGRRTAGAFSSFFQFDYYGSFSFQFASGDFVHNDGDTQLGRGVLPDEDILPLQSDLLAGRDTVVLRAIEWIKEP